MSRIFRKAETADVLQLKQLWADGFGDSSEDIDLFFSRQFNSADTFVCTDDDKILAAAYCLKCGLQLGGKEQDAGYLYALTSRAECRNQGIMTALIDFAKAQLNKPLWLVPADEKLRQFYEKRGFVSFSSLSERRFSKSEAEVSKAEEISPEQAFRLRQRILQSESCITLSPKQLDYVAKFYEAKWLKAGENALALAYSDGEQAMAVELLAKNEQAACDAVCQFFGVDTLTARVPYSQQYGAKLAPMIWQPSAKEVATVYANFEFN